MRESLEPPVIQSSPDVSMRSGHASSLRLPLASVIGLAVFAMALFVILFLFDPGHHGFYPQCLFHAITGLHCPGCGALRGVHELIHGRIFEALGMNPLVFLGLPLLGGAYLYQRSRSKERLDAAFLQKPLTGWVLLAVIVLFWILRNVPVYPFTVLAP